MKTKTAIREEETVLDIANEIQDHGGIDAFYLVQRLKDAYRRDIERLAAKNSMLHGNSLEVKDRLTC